MDNLRQGPDKITKLIRWSSFTSWIILIFIEGIFVVLNPSWNNIPARDISQSWIIFLYIMFSVLILINISGIIFNTFRLKRKTDRMRTTFFLSILASIIGLLIISI